jgi:hypothetical protein
LDHLNIGERSTFAKVYGIRENCNGEYVEERIWNIVGTREKRKKSRLFEYVLGPSHWLA